MAQQSRKSNFLQVAVVDFQQLQQTQAEAAELHHRPEVVAEPALALSAEPAAVRNIGNMQRSSRSLRMLHRDLHLADWHNTARIEQYNQSGMRLRQEAVQV